MGLALSEISYCFSLAGLLLKALKPPVNLATEWNAAVTCRSWKFTVSQLRSCCDPAVFKVCQSVCGVAVISMWYDITSRPAAMVLKALLLKAVCLTSEFGLFGRCERHFSNVDTHQGNMIHKRHEGNLSYHSEISNKMKSAGLNSYQVFKTIVWKHCHLSLSHTTQDTVSPL